MPVIVAGCRPVRRARALGSEGATTMWVHVPLGVALVGLGLRPARLARQLTDPRADGPPTGPPSRTDQFDVDFQVDLLGDQQPA